MKKKDIGALSLKPGPTESGVIPTPEPVGGEIGPIDTLSVFLSQYGLLIVLLLLLPLAFVLYKKRGSIMSLILRARMAFWRFSK